MPEIKRRYSITGFVEDFSYFDAMLVLTRSRVWVRRDVIARRKSPG
jgi:hypothetical protein